ncbi:MAG TPA: hypothetical protein VKH44_00655, partial [Pirellulaceae bacterium]|nr:hypothetical protein [Pirellulaceae bacterium]
LIAALFVTPAFAAGKKNKNKDRHDPAAAIKKKLSAADLPTDAREKADKVLKDDAPKLKDAQAKIDSILTAEQKQARKQAQKDAKTSGKKRKDAKASALAAIKLTDEQKTKLSAAESELKSAQAALMRDLRGVLSPEQIAKVGLKTKKKKA